MDFLDEKSYKKLSLRCEPISNKIEQKEIPRPRMMRTIVNDVINRVLNHMRGETQEENEEERELVAEDEC